VDDDDEKTLVDRDEVRVRGVVFYNLLNALRVRHGQRVAEDVLDAMDPFVARSIRERKVDASTFYPSSEHRHMYRAACEVTGRGPEIAREFGRFTIEHNIPVLYRMCLHALTPDFAIQRAHSVYRRYFDRGAVRLLERAPRWAVVEVGDCPGFDECLWLDVLGGCEGALLTTGAREVEIGYIAGGTDSATTSRIAARWR
jgi:hypothetical protein